MRTTTAPLACLASRPDSRESVLPPIVRSTVTGFRVERDVLDMNSTCLGWSRGLEGAGATGLLAVGADDEYGSAAGANAWIGDPERGRSERERTDVGAGGQSR